MRYKVVFAKKYRAPSTHRYQLWPQMQRHDNNMKQGIKLPLQKTATVKIIFIERQSAFQLQKSMFV